MFKSIHMPLAAALALPVLFAGCSSRPSSGTSSNQANDTSASADTDCRVVLREFGQSEIDGGEVYPFPANGPSPQYVVYRGVLDVDTALVSEGATVSVWYQGSGFPSVTVPATACTTNCENGIQNLNGGQNPPAGFTRFNFSTTNYTLQAGSDGYGFSIQLIPFVTLSNGSTLYDHNRTSGNYSITNSSYAVTDNFSVCPAPDPEGLVQASTPAPDGGSGGSGGGGAGSCNQASDCSGALPRNEVQCGDGSFSGASWACNSNVCTISYCGTSTGPTPGSSGPADGGDSTDGGSGDFTDGGATADGG